MTSDKRKSQTIHHNEDNIKKLVSLEEIIFDLNSENITETTQTICKLFDQKYTYTIFSTVCRLVYSSIVSQMKDFKIYFIFLSKLEEEYKNKKKYQIMKIFANILNSTHKSQESYYLLEKILEENLIGFNMLKQNYNIYFAHYMKIEKLYELKRNFNKNNAFFQNIEELSKNNWELHKKLIKEGVNPNEISKIIRNDEIEKLQEISSQTNFNFNQYVIPSLYEKCSFINKDNVSLIDYAAFFSAIKCFKYLLINGAKVRKTGKYAVAGGNIEIIHLCEQNHSLFKGAYKAAIEYHRSDIFKYIYEKKLEKVDYLESLSLKCIAKSSYEIFSYLSKKEKFQITKYFIYNVALIGNLLILQSFYGKYNLSSSIIVSCARSRNVELLKYILKCNEFNINAKNV